MSFPLTFMIDIHIAITPKEETYLYVYLTKEKYVFQQVRGKQVID